MLGPSWPTLLGDPPMLIGDGEAVFKNLKLVGFQISYLRNIFQQ